MPAGKSAAMIVCRREHLESRCKERGYTMAEVMPCVVLEAGDILTVDEMHGAYPLHPKQNMQPAQLSTDAPQSGPGAELKRLLSIAGIKAAPTCSCISRAKIMDARGCDWCEANIDEIVGWLREEATKRKLPFIDAAGRVLVRRAIRNARRAAAAG